jgi:putative transposase
MTTFNSTEENIFHYLTFVAFNRVPVFKGDATCRLFIDALHETRERHPFKLIAYVVMPDHVHLIVNPLKCDIGNIGKDLKGRSAKKILEWLKDNNYRASLEKLKRPKAGKRNHSHSVSQKKVLSVDLWSHKFILQKMNYVHLNPVRAGLCDHPAKWKWSSCLAYLPHDPENVPIEPDDRGYWEPARNAEWCTAVEDRLLNGFLLR